MVYVGKRSFPSPINLFCTSLPQRWLNLRKTGHLSGQVIHSSWWKSHKKVVGKEDLLPDSRSTAFSGSQCLVFTVKGQTTCLAILSDWFQDQCVIILSIFEERKKYIWLIYIHVRTFRGGGFSAEPIGHLVLSIRYLNLRLNNAEFIRTEPAGEISVENSFCICCWGSSLLPMLAALTRSV